MSTKKIRLLSVEMFNRDPFVYVLGKPRPITIDGVKTTRVISDIVETEYHYKLFIANGAVSQEWKDVPKNDKVTVEYIIQ